MPQEQPQSAKVEKTNDNQQSRGTVKKVETPEVKENKNVWGHLSESMREEMAQYAKEGFLPKYREMLEKYYTSIANKSQKKSD